MLRAGTGLKTKQLRELIVAACLKPTISGKVKLISSSNGVMFADVPFDKGVISRPTKG